MLKPYLDKLLNGNDLTEAEAESAMLVIMEGKATPAQVGAYLAALRLKGETVAEITGSARAMRSQATQLAPLSNGRPLLDTAGTGGDGSGSFNISTAAAFIAAGAGAVVAKHGNRAASSKCGSADVLDVLGVNITLGPAQVARCIDRIGIGFMFAPRFHPAMKHAMGPRREIGARTIFNVLGPLTNPAGASHQLLGVYDAELVRPLAEVLQGLGSQAAFVVHGHAGFDELTTSGPNKVAHLSQGKVRTLELDPTDLGLRKATTAELQGGLPEENSQRLRALLVGDVRGPLLDVVLLNAAAALSVEHGNIARGLEAARRSLATGAALEKLNALVELSQSVALGKKEELSA